MEERLKSVSVIEVPLGHVVTACVGLGKKVRLSTTNWELFVSNTDNDCSCGCEYHLSQSTGNLVRTEFRTLEGITVCREGGGTSRNRAVVQAEDYKMRMPSSMQKMP